MEKTRDPDFKKFHVPICCEMLGLIILIVNGCFCFAGWIWVKVLKTG